MRINYLLVTITCFIFFTACTTISKNNEKQLRHIVLLKFKNTATTANISDLEKAFAELPSKIPEIADFEWGIDNSEEGLDRGFTHAFLVTFKSEKDRAIYLPHEAHQRFVHQLQEFLDDVMVIDYWTKK